MESQPQNPEIRNNPENFHPCSYLVGLEIKILAGAFIRSVPLLCL